jgi:hypothetical protein
MIRDVLLGVYALAWLVAVVHTQWQTGKVDPVLWATLGLGVGVILGIFKAEAAEKKSPDQEKTRDPS